METDTKVVRVRLAKVWTDEGNIVTLTFIGYNVDGKPIGPAANIEPVVFDRRDASEANRDQAERHGWEQKLGDAAALSRETKSGKSASLDEKRTAIAETAERLSQVGAPWNAVGGRQPVDEEALLAQLLAKRGLVAVKAE